MNYRKYVRPEAETYIAYTKKQLAIGIGDGAGSQQLAPETSFDDSSDAWLESKEAENDNIW